MYLPIFFMTASLAAGQLQDYPVANEVILKDMAAIGGYLTTTNQWITYREWNYAQGLISLAILVIIHIRWKMCFNLLQFCEKELYISLHTANSCHYSDVIMGAMASQITGLTIVYSTVYSVAEENIKVPRHWSLCREFTGDRWIPRTNGQ